MSHDKDFWGLTTNPFFPAMKTELFLLITVIGMSFGVNSRGAVDKDITKHVKDIVIDPESSDPEANMIDGDLSTITQSPMFSLKLLKLLSA